MHLCVQAHGGWKRVCDPLELKFQAVLSHPKWVLGVELRCSAKFQFICVVITEYIFVTNSEVVVKIICRIRQAGNSQ